MENDLPDGYSLNTAESATNNEGIPNGYTLPNLKSVSSSQEKSNELPPGYELNEEKYGGAGNVALAGLAGAARGLTLGASDLALTGSGLVAPETLKGLSEENPIASTASNVVGSAGLLYGTGGLGALAGEVGTAGKLGLLAAEGGVFGGGNVASNYAMGDHDLNAQKIMSSVGTGAALALGGGLLLKGLGTAVPVVGRAVRNVFKSGEGPGGGGGMPHEPSIETGINPGAEIEDAPLQKTGVQATSFEELENAIKKAKYQGYSLGIPQKERVLEAINETPMENPFHPIQTEALDSQENFIKYKTKLVDDSEIGRTLNEYQQGVQKPELIGKTETAIQNVAPKSELTSDLNEAGEHANAAFEDAYRPEQKTSGEMVAEAKKFQSEGYDHLTGIVNAFKEVDPKIADMLEYTNEGELKVLTKPAGMPTEVYSAVRDAIKYLRENPQDFSKLFDIRDELGTKINLTSNSKGAAQVRTLKAVMMRYLQSMVDDNMPKLQDAFKRYAINEQNREFIEKTLRGSVGNPEFGVHSNVVPEKILNNIFKDTTTVSTTKNILGPSKFNEVLANWLSANKARVTDTGVFSSNKWNTFLNNNKYVLEEAFKENPEILRQIQNYTVLMRAFPDVAPANAPNTAPTLLRLFRKMGSPEKFIEELTDVTKEHTYDKIKEQVAKTKLNSQLSGDSKNASVSVHIQKMLNKSSERISKGAKSIFSSGEEK